MRSTSGKTELLNKQKSVALGTAQGSETTAGNIYIYINIAGLSKTYTQANITFLQHSENGWDDEAVIVLNDPGGTLEDTDYKGQKLTIGYGYNTSAGNQYSNAPPLWVIRQRNTAIGGKMTVELHCIGRMSKLQYQRVMGDTVGTAPAWPEDTPVYAGANASILKELLVTGLSETVTDDTGGSDAGTADTSGHAYQPALTTQVNDTIRAILRRVMPYTGTSLRYEEDDEFHLIWTQNSSPSADYTYSVAGLHPVTSSVADTAINLPNRWIVADVVPNESGTAHTYVDDWNDTAHQTPFGLSTIIIQEGAIGSNAEALDIATSFGTRSQKLTVQGAFVTHMNCFAEIYDYVTFIDQRNSTSLSGYCRGITRVYEAGKGMYLMEVRLGGLTQSGLLSQLWHTYKSSIFEASAWPPGMEGWPPGGGIPPPPPPPPDGGAVTPPWVPPSEMPGLPQPGAGWWTPSPIDASAPPLGMTYPIAPTVPIVPGGGEPAPGISMPGGYGYTAPVDASAWPAEMQESLEEYIAITEPEMIFPQPEPPPATELLGTDGAGGGGGGGFAPSPTYVAPKPTPAPAPTPQPAPAPTPYTAPVDASAPPPTPTTTTYYTPQVPSAPVYTAPVDASADPSGYTAPISYDYNAPSQDFYWDPFMLYSPVYIRTETENVALFADQLGLGHVWNQATISGGSITNNAITGDQIVAKDFRTDWNIGDAGGGTGIRITSAEIAGYSSGTTKEFYLSAADGKAYAGGGEIVMDSTKLEIGNAAFIVNKTKFYVDTDHQATGFGTDTPTVIISWDRGADTDTIINVKDTSDYARIVAQGQLGGNLELVDLGGGTNTKWTQLHVEDNVFRISPVLDSADDWGDQGALLEAFRLDLSSGNIEMRHGDLEVANPDSLGSESLNEGDFATHAKWDVANDFDDSGGNATYVHSSGAGTLTQTSGNMAVAGVGNRWYRFDYTCAGVTENGTIYAEITTAFAATAQVLDISGTHTRSIIFKSTASPGNFIISGTSTASGDAFNLDDLSLKEVSGGDVVLHGILRLKDSTTEVWKDGSSNLSFKDSVTGTKTLAELAAGGTPSGLIAFFTGSCPTGWSEYTSARGRFIVGTPSGGTQEGTLGSAMTDLANPPAPAHTHNVRAWAGGAQSNKVARTASHASNKTDVTNAALSSGGNFPYIQLTVCEKD